MLSPLYNRCIVGFVKTVSQSSMSGIMAASHSKYIQRNLIIESMRFEPIQPGKRRRAPTEVYPHDNLNLPVPRRTSSLHVTVNLST